MKKEIIEQLLERYWKCETSINEERKLQEFFSGNSIPEELKKYIPLFHLKKTKRKLKQTVI